MPNNNLNWILLISLIITGCNDSWRHGEYVERAILHEERDYTIWRDIADGNQ